MNCRNSSSVLTNIEKLLGLNVEGLNESGDISDVNGAAILAPYTFGEGIFSLGRDLLSQARGITIVGNLVDKKRAVPTCTGKYVVHVVAHPVNGGKCFR